eukprot:m.258832 g.258832  ORF g.258832 m.258832 type:complete len:147 (-) comp37162_c0_seq1:160-600(-)
MESTRTSYQGTITIMEPKAQTQQLQTLEGHIESAVETLRKLAVITHGFETASQDLVYSHVNEISTKLHAIDQARGVVDPVLIPTEVVQYVDEGKNPELHLKEAFETLAKFSKSQQDVSAAFENFKSLIHDELTSNDAGKTKTDENQ